MDSIASYAENILRQLPYDVGRRAMLAGGAMRAFYDATPVKDYDVFFVSREDYEFSVDTLRQQGWVELPESYPSAPCFISPTGAVFNLVGFTFLPFKDQLARFDFRCCGIGAVLLDDKPLVFTLPGARADACRLRLVVMNNNGTERTLRRVEHYVKDYGYTVIKAEDISLQKFIESLPVSGGGY